MTGKDQVVTTRSLVRGSVLPQRTGGRPLRARLRRRRTASAADGARLLVLVPAHDAAATVSRTLASLHAQTRVPDRVVLLADDCTDATEQLARRFPDVTVMRTVENSGGRAGALNQGWRRWQAGADLVAVVDADTVLAPDCLEQLVTALAAAPRPGTAPVRFGFDQALGSTPVARSLLRRHPREHAAWATSALQGERGDYALGGQVAVHEGAALRELVGEQGTPGPWTGSDDQLVRALHRAGRSTTPSPVPGRTPARCSRCARWPVGAGPPRCAPASRWPPASGGAPPPGCTARRWACWPASPSGWSCSAPWSGWCRRRPGRGRSRWPPPRSPGPCGHCGHRTAPPGDVLAGLLLLPAELDFWVRLGCAVSAWLQVLRGRPPGP